MSSHRYHVVLRSSLTVLAPAEGPRQRYTPPGAPPPKFEALESRAKILARFDKNATAARTALAKASDAEFKKPWAFKVEGRTVSTDPKYTVYRRTVLNHLAHHRGQLTVYLRLNDAPVPAVYGPTADEPNF